MIKYGPRLKGKSVMLYVGGLRLSVVNAYEDLGMPDRGTGYGFAHNGDYQRTGHYVKRALITTTSPATSSKFIEGDPPGLVGSGRQEKYRCRRWASVPSKMHTGLLRPYHDGRDLRPRRGPRRNNPCGPTVRCALDQGSPAGPPPW